MRTTGKLFVVGLPIGHIEDITLRAFQTLKDVELVVAEDTRSFRQFFEQISTKMDLLQGTKTRFVGKVISYHQHNEAQKAVQILKVLKEGKSVALVAEAGTPQISDPGHTLIHQCYQHQIPVVPLPGPSALTVALSISPFESYSHYFIGFPPKKEKLRNLMFQQIKDYPCVLVAFESPHRLTQHLQSAQKYFSNRQICIQRELTKPFEEVHIFSSWSSCLSSRFFDQKSKGEYVIIYSTPSLEKLTEAQTQKRIEHLIAQGSMSKEIAKQLSKDSQLNRSQIYHLAEIIKKKEV